MMAIDLPTARSRRSLLTATIGAAAASIASALGRPQSVAAASGTFDSAVDGTPAVSASNTAASGISAYAIVAQTASHEGTAIKGTASHASGYTTGILGIASGIGGSAVSGQAGNNTGWTRGVAGVSAGDTGVGVEGAAAHPSGATKGVFGFTYSTSGIGVAGYANSETGSAAGVVGQANSPDGTGVLGYSGGSGFAPPAPMAKTGVYGEANQDGAARGVWGKSATGRGVFGQSTSGQGIRGYSATGAAGYFSTSGLKKGAAIRAIGRVRLDNCAGIATVASGQTQVTVTPGIDIGPTSAVVATVMSNSSTTLAIRRVSTDAAADTFTIHISGTAPAAGLKVAWHCFG